MSADNRPASPGLSKIQEERKVGETMALRDAIEQLDELADRNAEDQPALATQLRRISALLASVEAPPDSYWTPTPERINALPEPIRRYVYDLETRCDPAGDIRELTIARDTIRQLTASVEAGQAWQPIETAPKDGNYVLVWGTGITGIACWWSTDSKWHEVGVGTIQTPTHWMPLPDSPSSAVEAGRPPIGADSRTAAGGQMTTIEWAQERLANSVEIAASRSGLDREGWLEDVRYWRAIVAQLDASASVGPLPAIREKVLQLPMYTSDDCDFLFALIPGADVPAHECYVKLSDVLALLAVDAHEREQGNT